MQRAGNLVGEVVFGLGLKSGEHEDGSNDGRAVLERFLKRGAGFGEPGIQFDGVRDRGGWQPDGLGLGHGLLDSDVERLLAAGRDGICPGLPACQVAFLEGNRQSLGDPGGGTVEGTRGFATCLDGIRRCSAELTNAYVQPPLGGEAETGWPCHHNEDYADFRRKGTVFLPLFIMKFKTLPISLSLLLMEGADATAPCRTP